MKNEKFENWIKFLASDCYFIEKHQKASINDNKDLFDIATKLYKANRFLFDYAGAVYRTQHEAYNEKFYDDLINKINENPKKFVDELLQNLGIIK